MTRNLPIVLLIAAIAPASPLLGQQELERRATWTIPAYEEVRGEVLAYAKDRELDELTRTKLETLWPDQQPVGGSAALLDQLTTTLALLDPQARELVDLCRQSTPPLVLPDFPLLQDESRPPLVRNNLRLFYGRWLAQNLFYDEALQQLDGLQPADVVDPAALLFYQAAGYHRLLDKERCLPTIEKLLENDSLLPNRYVTVARLMQADLKPLKVDSLDEIARLMDEVRRRLALSRAGKRVRDQEDAVIEKLDKLIEKLEQQQQQQQQSGGGSAQSSKPAPDSMPLGGRGPGNVDPKQLGDKSGWGNLPPKQRQEALQQIGKELPAHYREVIEEYFRRLAREGGG